MNLVRQLLLLSQFSFESVTVGIKLVMASQISSFWLTPNCEAGVERG